jgi:cystathionine beta-synthase
MIALESIVEAIGNTPLVRLKRFGHNCKHNLLAKCEFLNPGGSVKDRIAIYMVERAEQEGRLSPGAIIVEATAGNTGIGLAMVAALKGYKLITVMTEKVSQDKVRLLQKLGAETVIAPVGKAIDDPEHFKNKARTIAEATGGWLADQFNNGDNVRAHYEVTGPEIWEQTEGKINAFVTGVGTGGTISGVGRYLKERNPSIKIVLADPVGSILVDLLDSKPGISEPYLVEGIGGDSIPENFHQELVDESILVTDEESVRTAYSLMKTEAMFVGSSSGCIAAAALKYGQSLQGEGKNIVAVLPDGGRAYMSTIYDDDWLAMKSVTLG